MPITADQERELLNRYKLTTLYPNEWPHQHDDDDDDDDDDESSDEEDGKVSRRGSKYSKIDRHASLKSSITSRSAPSSDVGVQKDEPDALGMAPSVANELRKRGLPVEDNLALRNKFMLSSTSFSPALYLSQVHQNATTEELLRGLDFLSKSIEQKSASLKVLVESNFERFVRAKATIDTVYTEMRTQGVEPTRLSHNPQSATTSMAPHSRQTSKTHSHFRNTSGPFGAQAKAMPTDKRKNALTKESEYGVQGIKAPLQELAIKAEEVWGPALGGREKEETLKAVQVALDQHREVFTLSGTVHEAIKKNDYDGVVDGYRKAKSHAEKARKIADIARQNRMELGDQDSHQIIVTARMWYDVNAQVDQFKQEVWRRLKTSHGKQPAAVAEESDKELHMELLSTLLQLGVDENPIWVWINSHYLYLKDRIARLFERSRIEIEILRRRLAANPYSSSATLAKHLRTASSASSSLRLTRDSARDLDQPPVIVFWEKVHACLVSLLSPQSGVLSEVLEWYNTAQDFIDNKAQKSFPTAVFASGFTHLSLELEHVEAIRSAAVELVGILRENVNSFFQDAPVEDISDLYSPIPPTPISPDTKTPLTPGGKRSFTFDSNNMPAPSPKRGEAYEKFAFWPPGANSLSGAHYLARYLAQVGTAMSEMAGMAVIKQSNEIEKLKALVVNVRERLITAICSSWSADSEKCRVLESWTRSQDRRDLTLMPTYFEAWEEQVLSNVQKIAYVSNAVVAKSGAGAVDVIAPPSAKLLQVVRGCFTTSLYKSLNGMVENAEKLESDTNGIGEDVDPDGVTVPRKREVELEGPGAIGTEAVDASNRNVRMLMTLSNLNHLRSEVIPQLISHFESAFSVKLTEESMTIRDVLAQIDARLFQSYVDPTIQVLQQTIAAGIASPTWEPSTPRPVDARPYVYDVLISLVLVHAEVTSTTTSTLTSQVLSYLLEHCSMALIEAFKRRSHYSLPALMQATLDVEFMAQTLNNYTTDKAGEVQSQIYLALDERTDNDARAKLQGELPEMRGILKKLRESTKGEFGCFRRERRGRRDAGSREGAAKGIGSTEICVDAENPPLDDEDQPSLILGPPLLLTFPQLTTKPSDNTTEHVGPGLRGGADDGQDEDPQQDYSGESNSEDERGNNTRYDAEAQNALDVPSPPTTPTPIYSATDLDPPIDYETANTPANRWTMGLNERNYPTLIPQPQAESSVTAARRSREQQQRQQQQQPQSRLLPTSRSRGRDTGRPHIGLDSINRPAVVRGYVSRAAQAESSATSAGGGEQQHSRSKDDGQRERLPTYAEARQDVDADYAIHSRGNVSGRSKDGKGKSKKKTCVVS